MAEQLTLTKFSLFPEEIRRYVWRLSLQPRMIEAFLCHPSRSHPNNPKPYFAPFPVAFQVCSESRSETHPLYIDSNGETYRTAEGSLINPIIDTLYCSKLSLLSPSLGNNNERSARQRYHQAILEEVFATKVASFAIAMDFFEGLAWPAGRPFEKAVIEAVQQNSTLREITLSNADNQRGLMWGWEPRFQAQGPGRRFRALFRDIKAMFERAEAESTTGWKAPRIEHVAVVRYPKYSLLPPPIATTIEP